MKRKRYTSVDIYRHYVADGGELPKALYKNICQDFNQQIMLHLIEDAGKFDMGYRLSTLSILRMRRNYSNPQVDWGASNKFKEELQAKGEKLYDAKTGEGTKWLIYHDEDWYCRFYWKKKHCVVPNKIVYKFVATRGKQGNKTRLKEHLSESSLNYLKYPIGNKNKG